MNSTSATRFLRVGVFSLLLYLLTVGFTNAIRLGAPWETDSVIYHLPIAQQFLENGNLIPFGSPLSYYPAYGEVMLSVFLIPQINWLPNTYNVMLLLPIFTLSYFLAKKSGLQPKLWLLFAIVITTLIPILRLQSTQTIDVWVLLCFLGVILNFTLPISKLNIWYGSVWLGLLIGSKYSGPFLFILIFLMFGQSIFESWKKNKSAFVLFMLLSLFWYVRNSMLTHNPFYPSPINLLNIHLVGDMRVSSFVNTSPLKEIIAEPKTVIHLGSALISELNVWLIGIAMLLYQTARKKIIYTKELMLGASIIGLYFVTPSLITNAYSDLRYILPGMMLIILSFYKNMQQKSIEWIYILSTFSLFAALSMISYQPKALLISLLTITSLEYIRSKQKNRRLLSRSLV